MSSEIEIRSRSVTALELQTTLTASIPNAGEDIRFEIRETPPKYRTGFEEPTVLVAIVSGTSAALSALLTGIFSFNAARKSGVRNIVIRGKDGTTIEFPADTPHEQITRLVELTRELTRPTIELP